MLDESRAVLVNAAVGSGKTTVLIAKALYEHAARGVPLREMAVLTFTNKAADEIRERMRAVRRVMKRHLTPRQRECLRLRYLRALSQREVAARLGIHQTTVSQHIRYALKKLRRILGT